MYFMLLLGHYFRFHYKIILVCVIEPLINMDVLYSLVVMISHIRIIIKIFLQRLGKYFFFWYEQFYSNWRLFCEQIQRNLWRVRQTYQHLTHCCWVVDWSEKISGDNIKNIYSFAHSKVCGRFHGNCKYFKKIKISCPDYSDVIYSTKLRDLKKIKDLKEYKLTFFFFACLER